MRIEKNSPAETGSGVAKAEAEVVHGIPIITYRMAPHKEWQLFVKRAFDIVFSSVIIILLSPLLLAIALAVKLTSPGPVK